MQSCGPSSGPPALDRRDHRARAIAPERARDDAHRLHADGPDERQREHVVERADGALDARRPSEHERAHPERALGHRERDPGPQRVPTTVAPTASSSTSRVPSRNAFSLETERGSRCRPVPGRSTAITR